MDVLTPNETESPDHHRHAGGDGRPGRAAAEWLLHHGVGAVVVTLGAKGALVVTPRVRSMSGPDSKGVEPPGRDAFSGALAVALAEGKTLVEAAAFANAAGSNPGDPPGTAPAMAYRDEVVEVH